MTQCPQGYRFAVASAGFRKATRNDVALLVSDTPAVASGTFTQNAFPAAPVLVAKQMLAERPEARAVVINSGQANACTGDEGLQNCLATRELIAAAAGIRAADVLPASTGVIGTQMNMDLWKAVAPVLGERLGSATPEDFAKAIMTTDAFHKIEYRNVRLSGGEVRFVAMAKGAGMICPTMATMLSVVLCDVAIKAADWQRLFRDAVEVTFNRVTVDGDTSTNDTVYGLANGASGVRAATSADLAALAEALTDVLGRIAYKLVQDGEGGSKVAHIEVTGAKTRADAEKVARTVGHSQLVKTALYGRDANWGRIVAAIGRSYADFDPMDVCVSLCGVRVFCKGQPTADDFDAELAGPLAERDIPIQISLGNGPAAYTLLASDLGHEYVDCNASYRS